MDPPAASPATPQNMDVQNAISEPPSMAGLGGPMVKNSSGGSILKVKHDMPVQPSQSSLLAIEEARRYQEVEKGYKARKAKAAAEGKLDKTHSLTVASGKTSTTKKASPQKSSELVEWEFTAPPKSDGCCIIS